MIESTVVSDPAGLEHKEAPLTPFETYIKLFMPAMHGWCTPEKAIYIGNIVAKHKPEHALEIGVFGGRSLVAIALAMKSINFGKLIGVDPWTKVASVEGFEDANKKWWNDLDHAKIKASCENAIHRQGVTDYVELIQATNRGALPIIKERNLSFGLLHIDGNHSKEQSCFDVENYVPMVPSGGIILFDDADWETTQDAMALLSKVASFTQLVSNCAIFTKN